MIVEWRASLVAQGLIGFVFGPALFLVLAPAWAQGLDGVHYLGLGLAMAASGVVGLILATGTLGHHWLVRPLAALVAWVALPIAAVGMVAFLGPLDPERSAALLDALTFGASRHGDEALLLAGALMAVEPGLARLLQTAQDGTLEE